MLPDSKLSSDQPRDTNLQSQKENISPEKIETDKVDEDLPDFFNVKNHGALQKQFKRFMRAKKQDIKYRNYVSTQAFLNRKDPQFKEKLREKFLEQAKKYFGVPYAPRYWKEGEKHYNAPLYLDCCALVRQIVYDLRDDFGFQLDRWNQAYQFDTLPKDLKFEEMRPGDLIFYSGTYFNEKLRKQKHDMVHVEIFTGGESGEQSIGARW
jgi:cell wall-associated NlpC family hydrolase